MGGVGRSETSYRTSVPIELLIDLAQRNRETQTPMLSLPATAQGLLYGAFVVAIIVFSGAQAVPFSYFQF